MLVIVVIVCQDLAGRDRNAFPKTAHQAPNTQKASIEKHVPEPSPWPAASSTTGQNGVLLFWDSSELAQASIKKAQASLEPIDGGHTEASVEMTLNRRRMHVTSTITSIAGRQHGLSFRPQ